MDADASAGSGKMKIEAAMISFMDETRLGYPYVKFLVISMDQATANYMDLWDNGNLITQAPNKNLNS